MKKMIKPLTAVLLLIASAFTVSKAADNDTRLYIATDKEQYAPAEKVQFQVFLLNPLPGTNLTAFVELTDCRGAILAKKMLPFTHLISWGDMELPASAAESVYLLQCYVIHQDTVQSRYYKKIFVSGGMPWEDHKIQFSVFYEGGSFVAESPNNVLLKCSTGAGAPLSVKGRVIDDSNRVYALFETNKRGCAIIRLNPEDKVQYYLSVTGSNGKENRVPLRIAMPAGITLNSDVSADSIFYSLISYTPAGSLLPEYRIEALQNGELVYDGAISFQPGLSVVSDGLPRKDLPAGFLILRLTDKTGKVYAKRVIYNAEKASSQTLIRIIDTVTKKEATVELPGYISGRAYINIATGNTGTGTGNRPVFFENMENNSLSFNDQLIAASEEPGLIYPAGDTVNRYLSLSGIMLDNENKPLKNKDVTLVIVQKNLKKQFFVSKTDKEGRVKISNLIFFDSATVYYQLADKSAQKNDVRLELKVTPAGAYTSNPSIPETLGCPTQRASADTGSFVKTDQKTLQPVTVIAEKEKSESEKFADKHVSGQMKRSNALRNEYDFIKDPVTVDNVSVFDFIKGRFPGLKIQTDRDGTPYISGSSGGTVGVYLNDMELDSNLSSIASLQVKDIALIKYYSMSFKPKVVWRDMLRDLKAPDAGDLLIYTKRDYSPDEKTKGLPKTTVTGYNLEKPVPSLVSYNSTESSLYWKAGWEVEPKQTIYISLPGGKTDAGAELVIEGINKWMAPYRFAQKLVFN